MPRIPTDFPHPTAAQCRDVTQRLLDLHGRPRRRRPRPAARRDEEAATLESCGAVETVLDALVRTLLSQNTTNRNSSRAMANFTRRFAGDYEAVRRAPLADIVDSIACGGLGNVKGRRIQNILEAVHAARGKACLEHLRHASTAAIQAELQGYPGVGPKTAGCVLLFCLDRDVFAVDTHIFRIAKALGWAPAAASRIEVQAHLDARVPDALKFDLHVLLVRHGQSCPRCAAQGRPQRPPAGPCPLPVREAAAAAGAGGAGRPRAARAAGR